MQKRDSFSHVLSEREKNRQTSKNVEIKMVEKEWEKKLQNNKGNELTKGKRDVCQNLYHTMTYFHHQTKGIACTDPNL